MSLKDDNPVNAGHPKRIALVLANPSTSSTTGWPVGFWWSELSHPYAAFIDRGVFPRMVSDAPTLYPPALIDRASVVTVVIDVNETPSWSTLDMSSEALHRALRINPARSTHRSIARRTPTPASMTVKRILTRWSGPSRPALRLTQCRVSGVVQIDNDVRSACDRSDND